MPVPHLAEALYEAHQQRSTGWLKVLVEGRESRLVLERGNLVGAQISTGNRNLLQSLLLAGLIDPPKLDSLWADGHGRRAIEALGLEWTRACEIHTLSQIAQLSAKASRVLFEEAGAVSSGFAPIPGERAVRAAWLPNADISDGWVFRCPDVGRCERWLLSESEREFIRGFQAFKAAAGATSGQSALLDLLIREGAVERARANNAAPERHATGVVGDLKRPPTPQGADEISWADLFEDDAPVHADAAQVQEQILPSKAPSTSDATHPPSASAKGGGAVVGSDVASAIELIIDQEALPAAPVPAVAAFEDAGPSARPAQTPGGDPDDAMIWSIDDEEYVPDDPEDPQQAARARRQRLLRRAMENMGALGPRAAEPSVASVDDSHFEPTPTPAKAVPSSDELPLVAALEKKFYEIESGADYFTVLGISRSASADEVKAAFVELAKTFHPDRVPASLQHLSAKVKAVFHSVREAYETLQSDSKRASYEASIRSEKAPEQRSNPPAEALEAAKLAEALLRKRDYLGAEQEYHRAYLLDPKATYLAAEAWAVYMDPSRRDQAPRTRQMMADAIKKDAGCERAHYQLGVIARVEGDMDRAEQHFRETVRLNPKHLEANQELRLIQMRRKKGLIR